MRLLSMQEHGMVKQTVFGTWALALGTLWGVVAMGQAAQAQTPVTSNGLGTVALSTNGQGSISICANSLSKGAETDLLVVPSGTVFAQQASTGKQGAQAFVTTETVTLTHMQPCGLTDGSTLVSHTRHWLVNPVKAGADVVFHTVGEVSGNGLDTSFDDETLGLRAAFKNGSIIAHVQGPLHDTVYLTESAADIEDPDAPQKP